MDGFAIAAQVTTARGNPKNAKKYFCV